MNSFDRNVDNKLPSASAMSCERPNGAMTFKLHQQSPNPTHENSGTN